MTPERSERIRNVCARRQLDLAVILENVHDPHNISAVLRTCDAVGVQSVYVLYTEPQLTSERLRLGKKSSGSARKWVDVMLYRDIEECMRAVRQRHETVIAAAIGSGGRTVYDMDLTTSTAFLFGNEKDGVSDRALSFADGTMFIPQAGMVRSLNISVACAITLYEAYRQRLIAGYYDDTNVEWSEKRLELVENFKERHGHRHYGRNITE